jgi:hypothetical protein
MKVILYALIIALLAACAGNKNSSSVTVWENYIRTEVANDPTVTVKCTTASEEEHECILLTKEHMVVYMCMYDGDTPVHAVIDRFDHPTPESTK